MTNYFKTLLSGIKASIEKNSKNDWNAKKDEIGYIENKPFYEETKTVNVIAVNSDTYPTIVGAYNFYTNDEDALTLGRFVSNNYNEPPESITVTVSEQTYELPLIPIGGSGSYWNSSEQFQLIYGAPGSNDGDDYILDTSSYPIQFGFEYRRGDIDDNATTWLFSYDLLDSVSVTINNTEVLDDSELSIYTPQNRVINQYFDNNSGNDFEDLTDNLVDAIENGTQPETIDIAVNGTSYTLFYHELIIEGMGTFYAYGNIKVEFGELSMDLSSTNPLGYFVAFKQEGQSSIFSVGQLAYYPSLLDMSNISININDEEVFNADLFNNNYQIENVDTQYGQYIVSAKIEDLINDNPSTIIANIDGVDYELPQYAILEGQKYYGATITRGDHYYYGDFTQYPITLIFGTMNDDYVMQGVVGLNRRVTHITVSYDTYKTIIHKIDKKFIPVVDIQVDDYIDWDNMTSENPVQNKVIADAMDGMYVDINNKMTIGQSYVTAGQKSGTTLGNKATAEGNNTTASGQNSHAEGEGTVASGDYSHAEGYSTKAGVSYSHAEGYYTTASGSSSHAEGEHTKASVSYSHAEGYSTTASGNASHAEGYSTVASGYYSHAEGLGTTAQRLGQHVFGQYNILDTSGSASMRGAYVEIVGNGTADNARSNARTLDWNGNEVLAGKLTVGVQPTNDNDVATKKYVDEHATNFISKTITIATTDWNSNVATISDSDITMNSVIFISPAPASIAEYNSNDVRCSAQLDGSIEFTCDTVPNSDISINILIL